MHADDAVPRIGGASNPEGEEGRASTIAGIPLAVLDAHRLTLTIDDARHVVVPACSCGTLEPTVPVPLALTTRTLARQHATHLLELAHEHEKHATSATTPLHATITR